MALKDCPECSAQVSDSANSCPHCGVRLKKSVFVRLVKWTGLAIGVPFALLVIYTMTHSDELGRQVEAKKKTECSTAIMSDMGTSTRNYADRAAYEARVRDACSGMTINGKPVAP